MSQLFSSGGQSIGISASALVNQYSNEYSGLISFRMDWLDLLAVQGTLKSLLKGLIFFAAKDGEALYSQQKQGQKLAVAQIMNSLLPNSDLK